jgi:hypothetical protein
MERYSVPFLGELSRADHSSPSFDAGMPVQTGLRVRPPIDPHELIVRAFFDDDSQTLAFRWQYDHPMLPSAKNSLMTAVHTVLYRRLKSRASRNPCFGDQMMAENLHLSRPFDLTGDYLLIFKEKYHPTPKRRGGVMKTSRSLFLVFSVLAFAICLGAQESPNPSSGKVSCKVIGPTKICVHPIFLNVGSEELLPVDHPPPSTVVIEDWKDFAYIRVATIQGSLSETSFFGSVQEIARRLKRICNRNGYSFQTQGFGTGDDSHFNAHGSILQRFIEINEIAIKDLRQENTSLGPASFVNDIRFQINQINELCRVQGSCNTKQH